MTSPTARLASLVAAVLALAAVPARADEEPAPPVPDADAKPVEPERGEPARPRGSGAALGPFGHEGALGTVSPFLRGAGRFQIAASGGFFQGTGLLVPNVPDRLAQGRAAVSLGATDWLSFAASFGGTSLENGATAANVLAIGDVSLGAVASASNGTFAGGAFLDARSLPAVGGFGSAGFAFRAGLTGGVELGGDTRAPVRFTANAAFHRDDVSGYQGRAWDPVTRLGYQAHRHPRAAAAALLEWRTPWVSPLVEARSELALGAPAGTREAPVYVTPALRVTPTDRLALDLGVAIGFNAGLVDGAPATLPWAARAGLSYMLEPFRTVQVVREVVRQKPRGTIRGLVVDAQTNRPLGAAVIALPSTRMTDLATHGRQGQFETPPLEPGLYPLVAQKEGYEPEQKIVTVRVGETSEVELRLKPQPPIGMIKGFIRDEKGNPLAATLLFPEAPVPIQPRESSGTFQIELAPGRYRVEARSIGYLVQGRQIELRQKETILFDFVLREVPATRVAVLSRSEIKINQVIEFEFNKARVLPSSYFILDEVVDILLQHPEIAKLEVSGHTDNIGGPEFNLKLSQGRASAVRDYLVEKGISPERLTAVGFGLTKPIAPNDNEEGRARNRRVEFLIGGGSQ